MLYIFDKDDNFKNIITEDTGLIDTRFKDYQNHLIDEPFVFHVDSESELLPLIVAENQVAFKHTFNALQQDVEMLKLMRIKEIDEIYNSDGYIVRVQCEPSWLELYDHFIEDRRVENGTAQTALNRALQGSRWTGVVSGEFGNGSTNFYWIDAVEALFKTAEEWGGTLQDYITLDENNEIATRIMYLLPRLGRDNGLLIQPGYNAETIERRTLSYPVTAIWGQGASLEIEDEEGQHTGGYTRYITFEDVVWSKTKGDPVDKPKGQKWVGDPDALARYGYLKADGSRMHRFGHFSNQDYETPEELLWATWEALQKEKEPEVYHEAVIDEVDKPIFLGDTGTILDRHYGKPIEVQSQITGLEYDILRPTENVNIVLGNYKDMSRDPLEDEIDEIKKEQGRPPIINDNSFPDVKPGTPVNVEAVGMFRAILVSWEYDSKIYMSHYEVYASQTADFVPDAQFLIYRGRVSSFGHEVGSNETWYYRVRAVNTHGTTSEFSVQVSASSTRIDFIDLEDEIKQEIQDTKDRAEEAYDNANLATQNAVEAIGIAQEGFDAAQQAITSAGTANTKADQSLSQAQSAFDKAQESIDGLSTLVGITDEQGRELTSIKGSVQGLQASVTDLDDNVASLQMTSQSLAGRLTDAEDNLTTVSATVKGLQTQVSDVKGNVSTVTQLANVLERRMTDSEGNISSLQSTASSLTSRIGLIEDWEFGGRNLIRNSGNFTDTTGWSTGTIVTKDGYKAIEVSSGTLNGVQNGAILEPDTYYVYSGWLMSSQDYNSDNIGVGNPLHYQVQYDGSNSAGYVSRRVLSKPDGIIPAETWFKISILIKTRADNPNGELKFNPFVYENTSDTITSNKYWARDFYLTKGEKQLEDWTPAPEDTDQKFSAIDQTIDSIATRVQTNADNYSSMTQTVQGIQSTVANKADKSTVTQLAGVVDTKISTVDANNRFATQSQLTQTASSLTSTITSVKNDLDGLEIGGRNYLSDSESFTLNKQTNRLLTLYWGVGTYTISFDYEIIEEGEEIKDFILYSYADGVGIFARIPLKKSEHDRVHATFEVTEPMLNADVAIYAGQNAGASRENIVKFIEVMVSGGNKAMDWSPAPEDMATQSELGEWGLFTTSQISQLDSAINLRVQKGDVINQINLDTSGVLISGKKLVLDGDTTVTGNFRVRSANIASIEAGKITGGTADFSKFTAINMRGLDIYGSRFRSSAGTDSMEITGGNIRLSLNNGRRLDISPTGLYGYNQGGSIRFQADQSLVTSAALGTSNYNVYLAAEDSGSISGEVRAVKTSTLGGSGNSTDYEYIDIRARSIKSAYGRHFYIATDLGELRVMSQGLATQGIYRDVRMNKAFANEYEVNTGNILYLRTNDRVRIMGKGSSESYSDLQTRDIYAGSIRNNVETAGTHFYIGTGSTGTSELRVTTNGLWGGSHDNTVYTNVRASGYYGNTLDQHSGIGGTHIYVRPSSGGELRVTRTGTTGTYLAVRASAFNESSSRDYKTDIQPYEDSALDIINQLSVVNFRFKDDVEKDIDDLKIGFIAEDSEPIASLDGKAIQTYKLGAYNTKAIQELDLKIEESREDLIFKIAQLELELNKTKKRVKELESAA